MSRGAPSERGTVQARKLDVRVRALSVRPMRNKWASCSTAGNLNFSAELLELDREIADYVIVHELLHFSVPNHGKLWKSLMRAHLGNYDRLEAQLRRHASLAPRNLGEMKSALTPTLSRGA